jgi:hypothetical protein
MMTDNEKSLVSDLAWKHTPDSIKEDIRRELKNSGYSDAEIREMRDDEERRQENS